MTTLRSALPVSGGPRRTGPSGRPATVALLTADPTTPGTS